MGCSLTQPRPHPHPFKGGIKFLRYEKDIVDFIGACEFSLFFPIAGSEATPIECGEAGTIEGFAQQHEKGI